MHIVFVGYYSFECNSAGHIVCLANALFNSCVKVTVFVPFGAETAAAHGEIKFECRTYAELTAWVHEHNPSAGETLIVAWTPRENVRRFVAQLRERVKCPYVVHLEDNEKLLTAANLGLTFEDLVSLPAAEIDRRMAVDDRLSHPLKLPRFIAASQGVTALTDRLLEFAPPQHPAHVFWPGYNPFFFQPRPINYPLRHSLGISKDTIVLVYPGNVHSANAAEIRSLYLATCLLNRKGITTLLIRLGEDYVPVIDHTLNEVGRYLISLGKRAPREVPDPLAMADFFVQPGHAGPFNDYRFPSKLPEFFAIGRPVLLPATNLGRYVRHNEDAIVLQRGDAFEIAEAIANLRESPAVSALLATNARTFAADHFQWPQIAAGIRTFYSAMLSMAG